MTNNTITNTDGNQATARIREMICGWAEAVRTGDSDRLTVDFAPDILQFDVVGPLQSSGQGPAKERARQWLSSFEGPVDYKIDGLTVETGGQKIEMWWRTTIAFREIDGKWTVVHIHASVPFNPADGKASLDLKP